MIRFALHAPFPAPKFLAANWEEQFETRRVLPLLALLASLIAAWHIASHGIHGGMQAMQSYSAVFPSWLWESLTAFGDERILFALSLPFCLRYPRLMWALVLAAIIGGLASRGLKLAFPMPRPPMLLPPEELIVIGRRLVNFKSLPSGHTVSAFACAGVWIALLGWRHILPLLFAASIVGFSRIAVGAHWPADILLGAVIGLLAAWAGIRLAAIWRVGEGKLARRLLAAILIIGVATLPLDGQGYPGSLPIRVLVCLLGIGFAVHAHLEWRRLIAPGLPVFRADRLVSPIG